MVKITLPEAVELRNWFFSQALEFSSDHLKQISIYLTNLIRNSRENGYIEIRRELLR